MSTATSKKNKTSSFTLPPELKDRMDSLQDPINWSAVCREAIEDKLADVVARKEAMNLEDAVLRLKASKRELEGGPYRDGHDHGSSWAAKIASVEELGQLERTCGRLKVTDWDDIANGDGSMCVADRFLLRYDPRRFADPDDRLEFWQIETELEHNDCLEDLAFIRGFCEGALELWREVKDRI